MKQKIFSDAFNICKRIKQINKNYFMVFNFKTSKFEIHSEDVQGVICTLPYSFLDKRSLDYFRLHLSKSNIQILEEVEMENENYLKQINEKITLSAVESAERVLRRR